jgi:Coenzyme PQQ synthesis protein D (PqqD)
MIRGVKGSAARIDARSVVLANAAILCSRLDDDVLAVDEGEGYCYSMNTSAARVWELIATPTAVGDLCTVLCGEFAVDRDTCLKDVAEILSDMQEAGLIKVTDAQMD